MNQRRYKGPAVRMDIITQLLVSDVYLQEREWDKKTLKIMIDGGIEKMRLLMEDAE